MGVRKIPHTVTPSIPEKTAVPNDRRISAPAPVATTKGKTPRMNANEVIRIGRSRNREASIAASPRDRCCSSCACAYSTIKIEFFEASPAKHHQANLHKDVYRVTGDQNSTTENNMHNGMTRITAKGSVQLSYRAA